MLSSTNSRFSLKNLVQVSILGGLAYLLTYLSVPILPMAPYMKLDFGDIPILLATVLLSTRSGLIVALLRAVLYFVFTGVSLINLIGISSLLIASLTIVLSVTLVNKLVQNNAKYVIMVLFETVMLTLFMSVLNYFVITPLYINLTGFKLSFSLLDSVLYTVAPFNTIKGLFIGIVFVIVYNRSNAWEKYKEKR
ncbi:Riboflavin transporter RibU [Apilactobacillus kunkeei]|uniref:ECF transporter S component n=1 Tax=Apilactobacillus kunkeei TaxID=148814 RepID=UPI00110D01B8|nr:ECF transporter S component [Apilactobacillus kunkeei]MCK8628578.1 ECF transporter S component [Apilactobacillus kunkeei]TMS99418.1 ECF transporter S component [Apilactobacillus kunkeei]CAI2604112.1 Riboflavin transporter RibU [Apilactobacillus kunkeei]CAI2606705.1 Riboflavin transporter RibU [Apilactobacillus kunkeei]CAI2677719.1 Riboflavin transporter RibU [Apilactobacillus kunkeei]